MTYTIFETICRIRTAVFGALMVAGILVLTVNNARAANVLLQPGDILTSVNAGDVVELDGTFTQATQTLEWGFNLPSGTALNFIFSPVGYNVFTFLAEEDMPGVRSPVEYPYISSDPFFPDLILDGQAWDVVIEAGDFLKWLIVTAGVSGTQSFDAGPSFMDGLVTAVNGGENPVPGNGGTTAPVPLPAAGWLMVAGIGGIGGLAALRRRKPLG